jgi:NTE family protein
MKAKTGLLLTGGGARAAYQAGVLKAISDFGDFKENPFPVLAGISAGAINSSWLANYAESFSEGTQAMWDMWSSLTVEKVYRTDAFSLFGIGFKWLKDLSLGEWFGRSKATNILDTKPLEKLLAENLDFARIAKNIEAGRIYGMGVLATNYHSGDSLVFFDGNSEIKTWIRGSRKSSREKIILEHILASCAIPIFFKPVAINGKFYGDGGIHQNAPLSSVIHLGADRILAIGINYTDSRPPVAKDKRDELSIGDILGTLLNSMFFGSLEGDIERLERINRTLAYIPPESLAHEPDQLRPIRLLKISPSRDLGTLATDQFNKFPITLRHLLKGIGVTDEKGWDILSYLAFESSYTKLLLQLGYDDALARKEEILKFFE